MDEKTIKLFASFDNGKLVIERQDAQPIDIITHEEVNANAVEVVEFGSKGNAVKAVQALLNCHVQKEQKLVVDGIFGKLTQDALIAVTGDSVCGFSAWEKLIRS